MINSNIYKHYIYSSNNVNFCSVKFWEYMLPSQNNEINYHIVDISYKYIIQLLEYKEVHTFTLPMIFRISTKNK
jgi:hypothetical protein